MRLPVSSGSERRRQPCRLQSRTAIRAGVPALLFAAGVALIATGAAGLGWALVLFGLGLAQLLWSSKIGAPEGQQRHDARSSMARSRHDVVASDGPPPALDPLARPGARMRSAGSNR
jgi:hypothetical protein